MAQFSGKMADHAINESRPLSSESGRVSLMAWSPESPKKIEDSQRT